MEKFLSSYLFTTNNLKMICTTFYHELLDGLATAPPNQSSLKCFPTFVNILPTGNEFGRALVLDLEENNLLHIMLVRLRGRFDSEVDEEFYRVTGKKCTCAGEDFFDYIINFLVDFVRKRDLSRTLLPLGITIPFLCNPESLKKCILIEWSGSFLCPRVMGADIGELFKTAIAKRTDELNVEIMVLLDSTTGTMLSCAHHCDNVKLSCTIGNRTNACYIEQCKKVETLNDEYKLLNKYTIVNTEWSSFGENGCLNFIRTAEDIALDQGSTNCGKKLFEKMVSHTYLGELVRLLLLRAVKEKLIFQFYEDRKQLIEKLSFDHIIDAHLIYMIEDDEPFTYEKSREMLENNLDLFHVPGDDMCKLHSICKIVGKRSAILIGLCLGVLINRINQPKVIVGINFNQHCIYRFYAKYDKYLRNIMRRVVHKHIQFDVSLSEDGASHGTAVITSSLFGCHQPTNDVTIE